MQNSALHDSDALRQSGAAAGASSPPNLSLSPLTSGFGTVIEKERSLQRTTGGALRELSGRHATEIGRMLRQHEVRLGANIALLEERFEMLPHPARFVPWGHPSVSSGTRQLESAAGAAPLPMLASRHAALLADVDALLAGLPGGGRAEAALTEVRRSHEEMGWVLTAFVNEDATQARLPDESRRGPSDPGSAEQAWDNEGGAARPR
jgi:hypothetical protein